jgi:3-oxoacyl-[acyl-carrier-protein] synthase-3
MHGADALAMQTDSERLLEAGVGLAAETWDEFRATSGRGADGFGRFICHQVGSVHRRRLYERLGLDLTRDFSTFEEYGNMGSVSLPATLAAAETAGAISAGSHVGLLGIGSGLNCLMLDLEW